jgi:hypothetical protein
MRRLFLAILLVLACRLGQADEYGYNSPTLSGVQPAPAPTPGGLGQQPNPYESAWPAPGQDMRTFRNGQTSWVAPANPASAPAASTPFVAAPAAPEIAPGQSSWYFRMETFHWNERLDGWDFVNEDGPLATVGYQRRFNIERVRLELFGGTMAYDGGAQDGNNNYVPYHLSNGTNYLGLRGEYDLLIEPTSWSNLRFVLGVGTRFWIRDLQSTLLPAVSVDGYQETWWTFYPYVGVETRESSEPGFHFFGSARFGITPLTYENSGGVNLYPRCGATGQAQAGVRFQKFSVAAYIECMTWAQSNTVTYYSSGYSYLQPASTMFTFGGQIAYTF